MVTFNVLVCNWCRVTLLIVQYPVEKFKGKNCAKQSILQVTEKCYGKNSLIERVPKNIYVIKFLMLNYI